MKKFFMITGILTGACLLLGAVLIGIGIAVKGTGIEFKLFNAVPFAFGKGQIHSSDYLVFEDQDIWSIDFSLDYANMEIVAGEEFAVEYQVSGSDLKYSVKDHTLYLSDEEHSFWAFDFSFLASSDYVKLYVPEKELKALTGECDMGKISISIPNHVEEVSLEADMGKIEVAQLAADDLSLDAAMGGIYFDGATNGKVRVEADMGSVEMKGFLGGDITVECDMGSIDITTYYSDRVYDYDISVDMGNSKVNRKGGLYVEEKYKMFLSSDMGSVELNFVD